MPTGPGPLVAVVHVDVETRPSAAELALDLAVRGELHHVRVGKKFVDTLNDASPRLGTGILVDQGDDFRRKLSVSRDKRAGGLGDLPTERRSLNAGTVGRRLGFCGIAVRRGTQSGVRLCGLLSIGS